MAMSSELNIYISDELETIINSVRELNEMVNERVYVAKVEGEKIDFTNFPEYSELQNLYSDMTYKL